MVETVPGGPDPFPSNVPAFWLAKDHSPDPAVSVSKRDVDAERKLMRDQLNALRRHLLMMSARVYKQVPTRISKKT